MQAAKSVTIECSIITAGEMKEHKTDLPANATLKELRRCIQSTMKGRVFHRMWLITPEGEALHFGHQHKENDHLSINQFAVNNTLTVSALLMSASNHPEETTDDIRHGFKRMQYEGMMDDIEHGVKKLRFDAPFAGKD